jgi:hypothetical protein
MSSDLVEILAKRSLEELVQWGKDSIEEAGTWPELRKVKAIAAAVEAFQKSIKSGDYAIAASREIQIRAKAKLGEQLARTEKGKGGERGGKASLDGSRKEPSNPTPTLAEMGLSKKESAEAQELARAGAAKLEAGIKALREAGELSEGNVQKVMRQALRDGLDPPQIEEIVKQSMGARRKAGPPLPATHLYSLDGLTFLDLDPAACAEGLFPEERAKRIAMAREVIAWLTDFILAVEELDEHEQKQAA